MDIVVTGYAGYDGSVIIYRNDSFKNKLLGRYPKSFFDVFEKTDTSLFVVHENDKGILAKLWKAMKEEKLGGEYSMREIPILQQTVEICEFFGLDPYKLYCPSAEVHIAHDEDEKNRIFEEAKKRNLPAKVIGHTAKGPAIKRTDGAETAFLRRPEEDEIYKMITE